MHAPATIEYDRLAARYDQRWAPYLATTVEASLRLLPDEPPGRVLDVGCGTGLLLERLAERWPESELYGVDPSPGMLEQAARRPALRRARLIEAPAETLPVAAARFDLALTSSSLHYWSDPDAGLRAIHRALAPGGSLLVTDWCADFATTRSMAAWLKLTRRPLGTILGVAELRRLLATTGFVGIDALRYRAGAVWGMMTLTAQKPRATTVAAG